MTLYEQFTNKQIEIIEYCEKAYQVLIKAIGTTVEKYKQDEAYGKGLIETLKDDGDPCFNK